MPRSFTLVVDRELCDKVTPGNRVKVVAVLSIHSKDAGGQSVNNSFLKVIGLQS
jgi:DNA replicative helicase MCM subunit Mcm2 (Cdc46/Mcm family)